MKKTATISDLHIVTNDDDRMDLFTKFCNELVSKNYERVIFLGDIFEFMLGAYEEYFSLYPRFFQGLQEIDSKNIEIIYIEGNHDFHLEDLFKKFEKRSNVHVRVIQDEMIEEGVLFCHGDHLLWDSQSYLSYRKKMRSFFIRSLCEILPHSLVHKMGLYFSSQSRRKRIGGSCEEKVKARFQKVVSEFCQYKGCHTCVFGHSHVLDDSSIDHIRLLNNGFPQRTGCFVSLDGGNLLLKSL